MTIDPTDKTRFVEKDAKPNYDKHNPALRLVRAVEEVRWAAEAEHYLADSAQFLFPYRDLEFWGPAGDDAGKLAVPSQDNKEDFQKQNVADFKLADCNLARGWAAVDDTRVPFVRLSYEAGPGSKLSVAARHQLSKTIKANVKIGNAGGTTVDVPYNPRSDRYEVEIWGDPGFDLRPRLDTIGQAAIDRGGLIVRPDLVKGAQADFARERVSDKNMRAVAPDHAMHPVLPLRVEVAWGSKNGMYWDDNGGSNYRYAFGMPFRGWDNYLGAGVSGNPHGGVGFLEFRNLFSNYFGYKNVNELGRNPAAWGFDGFGSKGHNGRREPFLAVDYMDLHVLKGNAVIGIHRHRDNQEVFLMLHGQARMVLGDWCRADDGRERCFELRTMRAGELSLVKPGQLHGLINAMDEDVTLFMFGGYD